MEEIKENFGNKDNLVLKNDGLWHDEVKKVSYVVSNGDLIPLISPLDGKNLLMMPNNLFVDIAGINYRLSKNNQFIPIRDPFNGSILQEDKDGNYINSLGKKLFFDLEKEAYIPLYIPDHTLEDAHIEEKLLVGDVSKRSFEIDDKGNILTKEILTSSNSLKDYLDLVVNKFNENEEETVSSEFTVVSPTLCHHCLKRGVDDKVEILSEKTFFYNEDFKKDLLEPAIANFVEKSLDCEINIIQNNNNINFIIIGLKSILIINNIDLVYANTINDKIRNIKQVVESNKAVESAVLEHNVNNRGFANNSLIIFLSGFILVGILLISFMVFS
ncbi:MAG: hypothetical protein RR359_05075 [Bacilli bacterium]